MHCSHCSNDKYISPEWRPWEKKGVLALLRMSKSWKERQDFFSPGKMFGNKMKCNSLIWIKNRYWSQYEGKCMAFHPFFFFRLVVLATFNMFRFSTRWILECAISQSTWNYYTVPPKINADKKKRKNETCVHFQSFVHNVLQLVQRLVLMQWSGKNPRHR